MSETTVPVLDVTAEITSHLPELMSAVEKVLLSGQFIMGPNVKALEQEVAAFLGVRHAVALNSGTDALVLCLRAMGIGPGDEVVTTAFTFFATAEAISILGAKPVFVDIDPRSFNIDTRELERAVTEKTKALLPVHLYGQTADLDPILALGKARGIPVLEDCAQSFGARYRGRMAGSLGVAGALSFFPSKILGACGDGGMLVTGDDALADACRMLRVHGARRKYYNEAIGFNSRLDEIQAAILRVKLPHVSDWCGARARLASRYDELLAGIPGVETPAVSDWGTHVFHQYTVRVKGARRDAVAETLKKAGVQTMVYYPVPMHKLSVYASEGLSLPHSEAAAAEVLSLPIWPQMDDATQERVARELRRAVA